MKQAPSESSGSGVVIEGKRILTNAHVVRYASQIQVQANQSGDRLSATVEAVAPGIGGTLTSLLCLNLTKATQFPNSVRNEDWVASLRVPARQ